MAYKPISFAPVTTYQPGQTYDNFKDQATNQYAPVYNEKVNALKASLAQNLAALEGQKTGINQNYDTQVTSQNINNRQAKNNMSNTMLGRGLGRSSVVTSGLGEQDMVNNRVVNGINTFRNTALGNVDAQKSATEIGTNDQIAGMSSDLQTQIMALAQQLQGTYQDNMFKQDTYNTSGQFNANQANQNNQMDYDKFEYGKTQDIFNNNLATKNFNLDKWYKEQQIGISQQEKAAKSAGSNPGTYGSNKLKTADYGDAVTQVGYLMKTDKYNTNQKIGALQDTYKALMAEMNPDAEGVAKWVEQQVTDLQKKANQEGYKSNANAYEALRNPKNIAPSKTAAAKPATASKSNITNSILNLAKQLTGMMNPFKY